jgi:hypothetical protein
VDTVTLRRRPGDVGVENVDEPSKVGVTPMPGMRAAEGSQPAWAASQRAEKAWSFAARIATVRHRQISIYRCASGSGRVRKTEIGLRQLSRHRRSPRLEWAAGFHNHSAQTPALSQAPSEGRESVRKMAFPFLMYTERPAAAISQR